MHVTKYVMLAGIWNENNSKFTIPVCSVLIVLSVTNPLASWIMKWTEANWIGTSSVESWTPTHK